MPTEWDDLKNLDFSELIGRIFGEQMGKPAGDFHHMPGDAVYEAGLDLVAMSRPGRARALNYDPDAVIAALEKKPQLTLLEVADELGVLGAPGAYPEHRRLLASLSLKEQDDIRQAVLDALKNGKTYDIICTIQNPSTVTDITAAVNPPTAPLAPFSGTKIYIQPKPTRPGRP
jgi:hypothetical protein